MSQDKTESPRKPWGQTSRRSFLQAAASAAATVPVAARAGQSSSPSSPRRILAWVGTYSTDRAPDIAHGRGPGIIACEMNPATGALTQLEIIPNDTNPSWLTMAPSGKYLYSCNELIGGKPGSVSAYAIDRATGHLNLLNTVGTEGAGPGHMSIHPSGKFGLVINYLSGSWAVLPIHENGELGTPTDLFQGKGTTGPERAHTAPPGSFAINGHNNGPHPHMIEADKSGRFVLGADNALDLIFIWKFDSDKGKLTPNDPASVSLPPGDGPRHFAFHPSGKWLYSLQEEASTLVTFDFDSSQGRLTEKQTVSTLPKGFVGTNLASGVIVSADGKFLYAANRLHDGIAWYSIDATGMLTWGGDVWTHSDYPRSINIDPTGNFLFSCNLRGDALTSFRINRKTGALTFTGLYTPAGSPSHVVFLG